MLIFVRCVARPADSLRLVRRGRLPRHGGRQRRQEDAICLSSRGGTESEYRQHQ